MVYIILFFNSVGLKLLYYTKTRPKQLYFMFKVLKMIRICYYIDKWNEMVHTNCKLLIQYLLNYSYYPRTPCQVTSLDISVPVSTHTVYCPQDTCGRARLLCSSRLGAPTLLSRYTRYFYTG